MSRRGAEAAGGYYAMAAILTEQARIETLPRLQEVYEAAAARWAALGVLEDQLTKSRAESQRRRNAGVAPQCSGSAS